MRTDRGLLVQSGAASERVYRPPEATSSSMGCRAARASRRTPTVPKAAAPGACWQRKAPALQRTSHRTATPGDRNFWNRTGTPSRPRARNPTASPPVRFAAPGPASAPICRCRRHVRLGRPAAPARWWWPRSRTPHRRSARPPWPWRGRSECRRSVQARCLAPAGDRSSAGRPFRSSTPSGPHFDRGLSVVPCA